jgi:hypothetical protein
MKLRDDIHVALEAWRAAERALTDHTNGDGADLRRELVEHRNEYQRLSSELMHGQIESLREAEGRRSGAIPSTPTYHRAAQDAEEIAGDIWETARQNDRDTPKRGAGGETRRSRMRVV